MNTQTNKKTIREFTRIFKNEHNVNAIDHLFAADFKHNFKMPLPPGLEGFKAIGSMMNTCFPDVLVTEMDLIASEDNVVERSHAKATHRADFFGIPATGKNCQWTEIHIYKINSEGKICEHWVELSMLELITQLKGE